MWLLAGIVESCQEALEQITPSDTRCIMIYEQIELLMQRCTNNYSTLSRMPNKQGCRMRFSGTKLQVIVEALPLLGKDYIDILLQQLKDFAHKEMEVMLQHIKREYAPVVESKILNASPSSTQIIQT